MEDYYSRFLEFINETTIDDLLKKTAGYQHAMEGINAVNEWVKQHIKSESEFKEFNDIFSDCLITDETLWFNLSWRCGWMWGVIQGLKTYGADSVQGENKENEWWLKKLKVFFP